MTSSKFTLTLAENFRVRIFGYQSDNKYLRKAKRKLIETIYSSIFTFLNNEVTKSPRLAILVLLFSFSTVCYLSL